VRLVGRCLTEDIAREPPRANYLENYGWHPRGFADARRTGPADMISAMSIVCVWSKPYFAALTELQLALGMKPTDWQDAPDRTQAEVIAKLRECGGRG
jgi:hypothetical protein